MTFDELAEACDVLTKRDAKPTVPEVLPLLNAYYAMPGCGDGGAVHLITEDNNWKQMHTDWCAQYAGWWEDNWCPEDRGPHHLAIARLLQRCTGTQRRKPHAKHSYPWTATK